MSNERYRPFSNGLEAKVDSTKDEELPTMKMHTAGWLLQQVRRVFPLEDANVVNVDAKYSTKGGGIKVVFFFPNQQAVTTWLEDVEAR